MPAFAREHARPLVGSALLHAVLLALLAAAAMNWRSHQEAVPLAIEGTVVQYENLPPSLRSGRQKAAPAPTPPAARPEPKPQPPPSTVEEQPRPVAAEQRREEQAEKARAQREAQRAAAAEQKRRTDEAARARAAEESKRKAAEAETRRQAEAEAAKQKAASEQAALAAKARAARESELKRALAAEEEGEAVARSGVTDEYRALLVQAIERNWIRPPSARAGLECTLNVTQVTGGTVIDVRIGDCNGDQAVRESITNAVYKSSPLPAPRDPRAFQRQLVIVFKPTE
jgi:colicin import membrane protein